MFHVEHYQYGGVAETDARVAKPVEQILGTLRVGENPTSPTNFYQYAGPPSATQRIGGENPQPLLFWPDSTVSCYKRQT